MTKNEIQLLYVDLNRLLDDICLFLNEEIRNGRLSDKARSEATNLIHRSKQQLQEISKVTSDSDSVNEAYVDMKGQKAVVEECAEEDPQEIYSDPEADYSKSDSASTEDETVSPYANFPAIRLSEDTKCGLLWRKERFFFMDQYKKTYAGVHETWLLVYSSEKDAKPSHTYNLINYEAKPTDAQIRDQKKKELSFDLMNLGRQKSYQFAAKTPKDMLQWVAAINKCRLKRLSSVQRNLPPLPKVENEEVREEVVYEPFGEDNEPKKFKPTADTTQVVLRNKAKLIPQTNSIDSCEDRYEPLHPNDESSFSEDDDPLYHDVLLCTDMPVPQDEEEEDFYDIIQPMKKPEELVKPRLFPSLQKSQSIEDEQAPTVRRENSTRITALIQQLNRKK